PSVAFDRNENFYIVASESFRDGQVPSDPGNSSGAIVFMKYAFTDLTPVIQELTDPRGTTDLGAPTGPPLPTPLLPVGHPFAFYTGPITFQAKPLYLWANNDPAVNPTIVVDTNLPSFTDPITGATQNDPLSGEIYVAWNTNNALPTPNGPG